MQKFRKDRMTAIGYYGTLENLFRCSEYLGSLSVFRALDFGNDPLRDRKRVYWHSAQIFSTNSLNCFSFSISAARAGRRTQKVLPLPGPSEVAQISPPWSVTILFAR